MRPHRWVAATLAAVAVTGCGLIGPRSVPIDRFNYNQAIARSWDEQLLLNLLRLREGKTPQFLEVGNVVAQYTFNSGASANALFNADSRDVAGGEQRGDLFDQYGFGLQLQFTESPTITYQPLTGQALTERLLMPIPLSNILMLRESGWDLYHLFSVTVVKVNDVRNMRERVTIHQRVRRTSADFLSLLDLVDRTTSGELAHLSVRRTEETESLWIFLGEPEEPGDEELLEELRRALGVSEDATLIPLVHSPFRTETDQIAIDTRSLLSILTRVAQLIEMEEKSEDSEEPQEEAAGDPDGPRPPELIRVLQSDSRPTDPFVRVRYRGSWYHIDNSDLESIKTFALITYLYAMQGTETELAAPVLTIQTGD
jgi:hypothetical protein